VGAAAEKIFADGFQAGQDAVVANVVIGTERSGRAKGHELLVWSDQQGLACFGPFRWNGIRIESVVGCDSTRDAGHEVGEET
jgi:hypothetical protein